MIEVLHANNYRWLMSNHQKLNITSLKATLFKIFILLKMDETGFYVGWFKKSMGLAFCID